MKEWPEFNEHSDLPAGIHVRQVSTEARLVFDPAAAQNLLGGSVFWIRRAAAIGGEEATIAHWEIKRDGNQRGILE